MMFLILGTIHCGMSICLSYLYLVLKGVKWGYWAFSGSTMCIGIVFLYMGVKHGMD